MWAYHNPVRIVFGPDAFGELPVLLRGRRYVLVTYPEEFFAGLAERLAHRCAGLGHQAAQAADRLG